VECAASDKIIQRAAVRQKFGGQSMSQAAQSWENTDFVITPEFRRLSDDSPAAGLKLGLAGGDGTVPVESLSAICRNSEIKSILATGVEHQGAYDVSSLKDIKDRPALQFTLRAIVKMVQEIPIP
jgi:hypothetical protein